MTHAAAPGAVTSSVLASSPPLTSAAALPLRRDLQLISQWIAPNSRVLDLGCGDGHLLKYLYEHKHCTGYGVEISDEKLVASVATGINVLQLDIDQGLALFENKAFDTVVLLETLPFIRHVEATLSEVARVGREAIVSFPNFGYWQHRVALLRGHMPVSDTLPYQWYDTPNVRFATLADFEILVRKVGLRILDQVAIHADQTVNFLPNLLGSLALFRLTQA